MLERYVAGARGVVLLYSLSSEQLESSSRVAREFLCRFKENENDSDVEIVVVGNKRDLKSDAPGLESASNSSYTELRQRCEQLGVTHMEISTRGSAVEVVRVAKELLCRVIAFK